MNLGQAQSEWHEKSERTQRANEAALSDAAARERALAQVRSALLNSNAMFRGLQPEVERHTDLAPEIESNLAALDTLGGLAAEQERTRQLVGLVQRWQPAGSPPPGGTEVLIRWIMQSLSKRAEDAEERTRRLEKALRVCRNHSLLQIRRAAFSPEIGVRYTEAIRAEISSECARLEQFIDATLDGRPKEGS